MSFDHADQQMLFEGLKPVKRKKSDSMSVTLNAFKKK